MATRKNAKKPSAQQTIEQLVGLEPTPEDTDGEDVVNFNYDIEHNSVQSAIVVFKQEVREMFPEAEWELSIKGLSRCIMWRDGFQRDDGSNAVYYSINGYATKIKKEEPGVEEEAAAS